LPNFNFEKMPEKKVNAFDIAINIVLIVFPILLMGVMVFVVISGEISAVNKAFGAGISVFGIVGTILVAIFKNELDKADSQEERNNIMEFLLQIFKNLKPTKSE